MTTLLRSLEALPPARDEAYRLAERIRVEAILFPVEGGIQLRVGLTQRCQLWMFRCGEMINNVIEATPIRKCTPGEIRQIHELCELYLRDSLEQLPRIMHEIGSGRATLMRYVDQDP